MSIRRDTSTPSDGYARSVVEVLAAHFDLDDVARGVILSALEQQRRQPTASFEVIVDSPFAASWRLRPSHDDLTRVRLGDYRLPPTRGERTQDPRQVAVNAALLAIA